MELAIACILVSVLVLAVIIMAAGQRSLIRSVLEHDRTIITALLKRTELQHGSELLAASEAPRAPAELPAPSAPSPIPPPTWVPPPAGMDGE